MNTFQIRRNLLFLGGVPRWVVDYLLEVKKSAPDGTNIVSQSDITGCFASIWTTYVESFLKALAINDRIRLAAYAVSGVTVDPSMKFNDDLSWARLRDSSLCLLKLKILEDLPIFCEVQVPYALLMNIGSLSPDQMTTASEKAFVHAAQLLGDLVNKELFKLQPWQLWERFGACFYALRINALQVIGKSEVAIGELLKGASIADNICDIRVKLVPSTVVLCQDGFGKDTRRRISRLHNPTETIDWISTGCIAVNGDNARGLDIFFALTDVSENRIVFLDQRKREYGTFYPSTSKRYLEKLNRVVCPAFLGNDVRVVKGVMNCVAKTCVGQFDAPDDCFFLSREESDSFQGALAYHPACSPIFSVNSASKTAVKTLFQGDANHINRLAEEIVKKRKEPSGGFTSKDHITSFVRAKLLKVDFAEDSGEYLEFSA